MKVKIDKLVFGGWGIGKINNNFYFVRGVLPNEEVEIKILKNKKNIFYAEAIDILKKSSKRIIPQCELFLKCGGCDYQHMNYTDEIYFKKEIFIETLARIGKIEISNLDLIPSKEFKNYRNRAKFKINEKKVGFYEKDSHKFISVNYCLLLNEKIFEALKEINKKINNDITDVEIFVNNKGEKLITLYKNNKISFFNKKYIKENVFTKQYLISSNTFFQVNYNQLKRLIKILEEEILKIGTNNKLCDLYCGVGLFAIYFSKYFSEILGIEINKEAIKLANSNAKFNKIHNCYFVNKDVKKSFFQINTFSPDVIICDPPRSGIEKNLLKKLSILNSLKYFFYISCNPTTLARDLKLLTENGWKIKKIYLLDMFPRTMHIESLCILKKDKI